jgi:tetratricopeptide (TPR) repeat protein
MVTAESVYQRVVAAAELAPDDYLIKPFNADILHTRLDAVLRKKLVFRTVYRAFSRSDLDAALEGCETIMREQPKYFVDALRFKGEILVTMGDAEGAEALYRRIIEMRAVPWSRLGLARTLYLQRQHDEAEDLLQETLKKHPDLVAGYDMLADVLQAQDKHADAQRTLKRGLETSPNAPRRQRRLGEVALRNKDMETAEKAFKAVLEKGKHSIFLEPTDCANLARTYVSQGNFAAANDVIRNHRQLLEETREGKLITALVTGQVMAHSGKKKEAQAAIKQAISLQAEGADCLPDMMLDMVDFCVKNDLDDEAANLLFELARNSHDDKQLLDRAVDIYKQAGKQELVTSILQKATVQVAALSKQAVLLLQQGDLKGGIAKMLEACQAAPRNPRVMMNAVWTMLRYLEEQGQRNDYLQQARQLLDDASNLVPGHPRLAPLETRLRNLENTARRTLAG